jgi:hypothetical protein
MIQKYHDSSLMFSCCREFSYEAFPSDDVGYSSIKQEGVISDLTELLTDVLGHVGVELGRTEPILAGRLPAFATGRVCDMRAIFSKAE